MALTPAGTPLPEPGARVPPLPGPGVRVPPLPEPGSRQPDPFLRRLDGATGLKVDVEHVANIGTYLATLADATRVEVQDVASRADAAMRVGGYEQSALGSVKIEPEVPALAQRTKQVYDAVHDSLADVVSALNETGKAVRVIAEKYKEAEKLNQLTADQVRKLLRH